MPALKYARMIVYAHVWMIACAVRWEIVPNPNPHPSRSPNPNSNPNPKPTPTPNPHSNGSPRARIDTHAHVCAYDSVLVSLECEGSYTDSKVQVEVVHGGVPVASDTLQCNLHAIECAGFPCGVSVAVPDTHTNAPGGVTATAYVTFDRDTNGPNLTCSTLTRALALWPPLTDTECNATWLDSRTLELALTYACAHVMQQANQNGTLRANIPNPKPHSSTRFRFADPGTYNLSVTNTETYEHTLTTLHVQMCADNVVGKATPKSESVPTYSASHSDDVVVQTKGVMSVPPARGLTFNSQLINQESWGVSMWLHLQEHQVGPPNRLRSVMFKGGKFGEHGHIQMTPSVWMLPNSSNLALRVSTVECSDVGAESISPLPNLKWVHLAFVFHNRSDDVEGRYQYRFYMNGRLDVSITFQHTVLPNDGDLYLLKDPFYDGPPALLTHLKIWKRAIDPAQVTREYLSFDPDQLLLWVPQTLDFVTRLAGTNPLLRSDEERDAAKDVYDKALKATFDCENIRQRLDMYEECARFGNSECWSFVGMLKLFGTEAPDVSCADDAKNPLSLDPNGAIEAFMSAGGSYSVIWEPSAHLSPQDARGAAVALFHLSLCILNGVVPAALEKHLDTDARIRTHGHASLVLGLLHFSALTGSDAAFALLAELYSDGGLRSTVCADGCSEIEVCDETSSWYAMLARAVMKNKDPLVERDLITDMTGTNLYEGQKGEDDHLIQHTIQIADEGDVAAMLTAGDLYYWGTRGVPRNLERALSYYQRAAHLGNTNAMCGAAGMYLKGEGGPKNVTKAIDLFEKGASKGSNRALNGLGFVYYTGEVVQKNISLALEYFLRAADGGDGDAQFNSGWILMERGDFVAALELFDKASRGSGHFMSVYYSGELLMAGKGGITRDATRAKPFLLAASRVGPWSQWLRRGYERYLWKSWEASAMCYSVGAALGFSEAHANMAYIADKKLRRLTHILTPSPFNRLTPHQMQIRHLKVLSGSFGSSTALCTLGDALYRIDTNAAIIQYTKASAAGVSRASLALALIYSLSGDARTYERAKRYYALALEQETDRNMRRIVMLMQALNPLFATSVGQTLLSQRNMFDESTALLWLSVACASLVCLYVLKRRPRSPPSR